MKYQCVECKAEWLESQAKELCLSCGGVLLPLILDDQAHMYPNKPPDHLFKAMLKNTST